MLRILKIHYAFILNKPIKIIILIISVLNLIFSFSIINSFLKETTYHELINSYYNVVFSILKLILTIISIIIFGFSFLSQNEQYRFLIISPKLGINKVNFFLSKVLLLNIFLIIMVLIQVSIVLLIGLIYCRRIENVLFFYSFELIITILYFSQLTILIIQLFNYFYAIFISIVISIVTFSTINSNELRFFSYILITFKEDRLQNIVYSIFLVFVLLVINTVIYKKKNLY